MQTVDPYLPPKSEFKGQLPGGAEAVEYGGFWRRVGAGLIDTLIVSPVFLVDYLYGGETRMFQLYMLVPSQLLAIFLYIFMVTKYGGTPGKLLLGMRIAMVDGAPVTVKAALLRYSVMWALAMAVTVGTIMGALSMTDAAYMDLSYMARAAAVSAHTPGFVMIATTLLQIWIVASIITMLANKKRRTLHDFIAGTVVVRK